MAQYVTDKASRMVDAGTISNEQASQIMLGVLAQEKFESKPGRDAIARMVNNTINDINALTRNEVGQEVASSFSASAAINAIARSNEPMSMRASIDRGFFRVAGQNYDIDRAEDMFIVTGNGAQRVSMRDTVGCELTDVAVVGNTIV
jgi:predicted RNA methylase